MSLGRGAFSTGSTLGSRYRRIVLVSDTDFRRSRDGYAAGRMRGGLLVLVSALLLSSTSRARADVIGPVEIGGALGLVCVTAGLVIGLIAWLIRRSRGG